MTRSGRYARFADQVLATAVRPFAAGRRRAVAFEFILALMLLLVLPAVASAAATISVC